MVSGDIMNDQGNRGWICLRRRRRWSIIRNLWSLCRGKRICHGKYSFQRRESTCYDSGAVAGACCAADGNGSGDCTHACGG